VVQFGRRFGYGGRWDHKLRLTKRLFTCDGFVDLEVKPDAPTPAFAEASIDAQPTPFRLMAPCTACADSHMEIFPVATPGCGGVGVVGLQTDRLRELIENSEFAARGSAYCFAIAALETPRARFAGLPLTVDVPRVTQASRRPAAADRRLTDGSGVC
jgi:hypothetical protein